MAANVRVLLLADSHLGLDLPLRPRVARRRRGHDFLDNYAAALQPARAGEVDVVVHAGDVFDRPDVPASLAYQAYEPLRRVAEAGVPVLVVPGNHERSRLPHAHLLAHPRIHVFDRPRTFLLELGGRRVAFAGFPYERREVRTRFPALLAETGWRPAEADVSVLCLHHCVEGATVGPADYTFTTAADVIRGRDIPAGFAAVVTGHVHRHQVLTAELSGAPLAAPVLYPGSLERTALAEIGEEKGYLVLELPATSPGLASWEFRRLRARPMVLVQLQHEGGDARVLERSVREAVAAAPADAVLTIRIAGTLSAADGRVLAASNLRTFVPATMNLEIQPPRDDGPRFRARPAARDEAPALSPPPAQHTLFG